MSAASNESSGAAARTPGTRLAAARAQQGLSVQHVAGELHLDPGVIEKLEADDFTGLGAVVYVRGHLRRYAQMLGEDPALVEALYRSTSGEQVAPDLTRIVTQPYTSAPRSHRLGTWPSMLIGVVIMLGGLVWWAMQQPASRPVAVAPGAVTAAATDGAAPVGNASAPAVEAATAPEATVPAAAAPGEPAAAAPAAPVIGAAVVPEAETLAKPADGSGLMLRFNADSWAEVYTQNGERKLYDLVSAGSSRRIGGPAPWRVVLGNVSGVTVLVDGRVVQLPQGSREDPIVRVWLGRDGRVRGGTQ